MCFHVNLFSPLLDPYGAMAGSFKSKLMTLNLFLVARLVLCSKPCGQVAVSSSMFNQSKRFSYLFLSLTDDAK